MEFPWCGLTGCGHRFSWTKQLPSFWESDDEPKITPSENSNMEILLKMQTIQTSSNSFKLNESIKHINGIHFFHKPTHCCIQHWTQKTIQNDQGHGWPPFLQRSARFPASKFLQNDVPPSFPVPDVPHDSARQKKVKQPTPVWDLCLIVWFSRNLIPRGVSVSLR